MSTVPLDLLYKTCTSYSINLLPLPILSHTPTAMVPPTLSRHRLATSRDSTRTRRCSCPPSQISSCARHKWQNLTKQRLSTPMLLQIDLPGLGIWQSPVLFALLILLPPTRPVPTNPLTREAPPTSLSTIISLHIRGSCFDINRCDAHGRKIHILPVINFCKTDPKCL